MKTTRQSDILARQSLHGIDIFQGLDRESLTEIAHRCQWAMYSAEEQIISERQPGDEVYFIVTGRVRVTVYSAAGKEITFRDEAAGDTFGELSAIDGQTRSAYVVALQDSLLAWMSAADFRTVLREFPDVAEATLKRLTGLVRSLSDRVFEFSAMAVKNRIHAELLRLARSAECHGNEVIIEDAPTHAEIASRVSTHREAVTRELNALTQSGIIGRGSGTLRILDIERLSDLVRDVRGN